MSRCTLTDLRMSVRRQLFGKIWQFRSHLPYIPSRPTTSYSRPPRILPADDLVEEERVPGYRPEFFYPADPGQILNNRYRILSKIGWGTASTVWLAEDLERYASLFPNVKGNMTDMFLRNPFQHVTVKITTSNPDYGDMVLHELDINKRLTKDPSVPGFAFIRAAFDSFMAISPSGISHLCLVFEPMRESLSQFQYRLVGDSIPPQLLKVYVDFLLQGSEYLHDTCEIIHTGLFLVPRDPLISHTDPLSRSQGRQYPIVFRGSQRDRRVCEGSSRASHASKDRRR